MTTIEQSPYSMPMARPALSTRVTNYVLDVFKALQNRRAIYALGDLTEAQLADIGLRRSDLHVATGGALNVDPTTHLGYIVQARAEARWRD